MQQTFYSRLMGKSKPENALCHILRETSENFTDGIGVFLAPDIVLTARHVVDNGKSFVVTNTKHEQTNRISRVLSSDNIDAALLLLKEPIGRSVCQLTKLKSYGVQVNTTGYLVTLFDGLKRRHPVKLCSEFDSSAGASRFFSNISVKSGYSGSPIVDQRGRILSITTNSTAMGRDGQKKPFLGVSPLALSVFLSDVRQDFSHLEI